MDPKGLLQGCFSFKFLRIYGHQLILIGTLFKKFKDFLCRIFGQNFRLTVAQDTILGYGFIADNVTYVVVRDNLCGILVTSHLKCYFNFLQGVGLNLDDALAFWKSEFSKKVITYKHASMYFAICLRIVC